MQRFTPTIEWDDYGNPYPGMKPDPAGRFVLTEEAWSEAGYVWNAREGRMEKSDEGGYEKEVRQDEADAHNDDCEDEGV